MRDVDACGLPYVRNGDITECRLHFNHDLDCEQAQPRRVHRVPPRTHPASVKRGVALMSSVRASYFWADGSHLEMHAWADDASPVAMAVARVTAVEALFEGMDRLEAVDEDDTDVLFPPESLDGEP